MGRELIPKRLAPFYEPGFPSSSTSGISLRFQRLFPTSGQIVHVLLTLSRLPLRGVPLACLIHAASVHSEPGSNSPSLSHIAAGIVIGSSQAPWRSLQALFPSHSSRSPKKLSESRSPTCVSLSSRLPHQRRGHRISPHGKASRAGEMIFERFFDFSSNPHQIIAVTRLAL